MSFATPRPILRYSGDRLQRKKRAVYGIAYMVEPHLNVVQKFVQATADDFPNLNVVQFRAYAAEVLLGRIAEGADWRTRNGVQRCFGGNKTEENRARELPVEDEELDYAVGG